MTSIISRKFLFDNESDDDDMTSIGSDEAVMIVNPNEYTLDPPNLSIEISDMETGSNS